MRPRPTILVKLLVAFAVPTLALFALFAYGAYTVTRDGLDAELGTRLTAVASSAATQLSGKYLVKLGPGNEDDPDRVRNLGKLARVAEATGVRLYVFDREFGSRLDTGDDVAIGTPYYTAQLDRLEIARVFDEGVVVSSVTFEGQDDHRMYKAGYAPLRDGDGDVVLVVGAQAPASYFDHLDDLRRKIFWWGAGVAAFVLVASLMIAVLITRPVRRLASAAERIGRGELDAPVDLGSRDEIGRLAETMDRMRGQLRERDVRTQQMLAGIAHEVRNPLAGMTLFTGILEDELGDDERAAHVKKIARELGYLERVVSEFLDYARRPAPELGDVPLRGLLEEVAQLVGPDADKAGVTVEVVGEPVTIRADAGQLRRAVLNLARNAIQAAEPGPSVRLGVSRRAGDAVIEVWDRGAEIPEDARARLFEPFFTTREKGTGLGLAFVREIARDHGGTVDLTSGGGETTFRVTLPAR